jgi:hypothetical protein
VPLSLAPPRRIGRRCPDSPRVGARDGSSSINRHSQHCNRTSPVPPPPTMQCQYTCYSPRIHTRARRHAT